MKSFDDKAAETTVQDIRAAGDSRGTYEVVGEGLVPADEIGSDEFPQYGDWLEVKPLDGGPEEELMDETFIECPGSLATWAAGNDLKPGDKFTIRSVRKGAGGRWTYSVEMTE